MGVAAIEGDELDSILLEVETCDICEGIPSECNCRPCEVCLVWYEPADLIIAEDLDFCSPECMAEHHNIHQAGMDRILAYLADNSGQLPEHWIGKSGAIIYRDSE